MNVLAASVLATVKLASGNVIVRAAVGQVYVICCGYIGNVLEALGNVTTVAVHAAAVGLIVASQDVLPNIFIEPSVVVLTQSIS